MLVDPNTGMPIEQKQEPDMASTIMGSENKAFGAATAYGEQLGVVPNNTITNQLSDTVPGVLKGTAWNTYRGSRAIGYGAKNVEQLTGFNATFNPKYWRSMPSYAALGGADVDAVNYAIMGRKYKPGQSYTPFNFLYKVGNSAIGGRYGVGTIARKGLVTKARELGSMSAARARANKSRFGRFQLRMGDYAREGPAFSPGTISRLTAADKIARGKMPFGNVSEFLGRTDKKLLEGFKARRAGLGFDPSIGSSGGYRSATTGRFVGTQNALDLISQVEMTADDAAKLTYASVNGSIGGRISGFMGELKIGQLNEFAEGVTKDTGKKFFQSGVESAQRFMEKGGFETLKGSVGRFAASEGSFFVEKMGIGVGEKVGLKVAGKAILEKGGLKAGTKLAAAVAVNAAPGIGQVASAILLADLAMDVGKLGVEVFKSGVDFAKEGAISFRGSINKGVMGMGYRDNTVAATSRARGVQAIQNSRLNARSVLGSEAGAMHAHFG